MQAIQYHRNRVRFFFTIELANTPKLLITLEQKKLTSNQERLANRLIHTDLVILDELGYLPFSQARGALLFHLIVKHSTSITQRRLTGKSRFS